MAGVLKKTPSTKKNPVYRRMFRNSFRTFMLLHIALWIYCLVTTWVNYAEWIQAIDCPFPNYTVKMSNIHFFTQSSIYLSYLTIPILWSAFMPIVLWITWLNYRWLDLPPKKRFTACWAWMIGLAKAKHFEMTVVTLALLVCEIAMIFAGLFSNKMIHFPPLGRGVYATLNGTDTTNLIELPGVFAQYRIGPRQDEIIATSSFAGNTDLQLPQGPWVLAGIWSMTATCRAQIEAAIPSFSKGVRWSSMAAIVMLLSVTIAFDVARLLAAKAAGIEEENDADDDYCEACCGSRPTKEVVEDDDEGCAKEFFGCSEDGKCGECCKDDDESDEEASDDEDDRSSTTESEQESDAESKESGSESEEEVKQVSEDEIEVEVKSSGEDKETTAKKSDRKPKSDRNIKVVVKDSSNSAGKSSRSVSKSKK